LTYAALAMSSVVRKAPMFAVLFLASRMRALQLDPPYGMPPFWMQCCFFGIAVTLYLETVIAAIVGATGNFKKAYYGVYIFKSESKLLQVLQHSCAMLTYFLLFPIVYGVYSMTWPDGSPAPLSTTLKCVVVLEGIYFAVMLGQSLTMFLEEEKGTELPILRDSTVSAGISLGLAPLLLILFVATRMRALQITQQKGDPPGWAQDCMLIAVFATCVQALCCLVMPIFIGSACQVDEDGNPDYDLQPMVGAYAVAIVKYVALMALHGSVIAICCAVFVMTPETAHSGDRFITSTKALFRGLAITMGIFLVALLFSSAKVIGMAIKFAIEACDEALLGVSITVRQVALNLFKGYVKICDLKVHNPEMEKVYSKDSKTGKVSVTETGRMCEWHDDYIAKVHLILLKVDVWRILKTLGKEFDLQNLSVVGVHVNVEKPNAKLKEKNSNIEYIMNHLDYLGLLPPDDAEGEHSPKASVKELKKEEPKIEAKKDAQPLDIPKIILRKIAIADIGAGVTIRGIRFVGQISFHPTIKGVEFPDIQRDVFGNREDLTPAQTVACIVKAIAKQIFRKVAHDIPIELAKQTGGAAKAAVSGITSSISRTFGSVGGMIRKKSRPDGDSAGSGLSSPAASAADLMSLGSDKEPVSP